MTAIDLARRAIASKHWRWMPGMRYSTDSWRTEGFDRVPERAATVAYAEWLTPGRIPDLTDPATLGCLLALVREAWGDSGASVFHDRSAGVWSWMADGFYHGQWRPSDADGYESEAAALVAALEAAPEGGENE